MDIQRKMKKEIEDVVGYGRLPCLSDKPNLPYCEAVMHESLRLENIVPFSLPHHVTNDIFYKGYKVSVPAANRSSTIVCNSCSYVKIYIETQL
jgi:cytochrome P450